MAAKKKQKDKVGRVAQIRQAYRIARQTDTRLGWILLAWFVGIIAAFLVLGFLLGHPVYLGILGFSTAILVVTFVFGRRAERAAYTSIEGQPGAAAAALNTLRKGWTVTPAVAVTRNQDVVHRVVGKCGVVLVAEGVPSRAQHLLAGERRRYARVVGDAPVHEIVVGSGEGQVPLRGLTRAVMKLPRALSGAQITELEHRLKALTAQQGTLPIPKGPLPKNVRMPKVPKV
jgi:hypothetical protein